MKKSSGIIEIEKEIPLYKHSTPGKVRFNEVDLTGIVHNIQYFYWAEWARTEYFLDLGVKLDFSSFMNNYLHRIVHAEIDYFNAASLSEEYRTMTRTAAIKNSSLQIDNIIVSGDRKILAKISGTLVFLDSADNAPIRIPQTLRDMLRVYEGEGLIFLD